MSGILSQAKGLELNSGISFEHRGLDKSVKCGNCLFLFSIGPRTLGLLHATFRHPTLPAIATSAAMLHQCEKHDFSKPLFGLCKGKVAFVCK